MLLQHTYADDSEMSFVSQNSARLDVWSSDRDLSSLKTLTGKFLVQWYTQI